MEEAILKGDDELGTYLKVKGAAKEADEIINIIEKLGRPDKEEENETEETT